MSGNHNLYCSGNQPDLIERLRDINISWSDEGEIAATAADEIERLRKSNEHYIDEWSDVCDENQGLRNKIERLREELKTERVLSFRNEVRRLEEQLAEITAERNRVWWREHWTEYEHSIASMEREACIDCIKAFSTDGDRSEEMIAAILRRMARRNNEWGP